MQPYACVRCQTRKVKCDRLSPQCSKCVKSNVQCEYKAPAPPKRGKRKHAEAELQSRLHHYETLLKENGVPLPKGTHHDSGTSTSSLAASLRAQTEATRPRAISNTRSPETGRPQSTNTFIANPIPHMGNALWQDLMELREKGDMSSDEEEDAPIGSSLIDDGSEIVLGVDSEVSCEGLQHVLHRIAKFGK